MRELLKAIKETKEYAGKYHQKLNDRQLFLRLISKNIYDFKKVATKGVKIREDEEWKNKVSLANNLVEKHLFKMKGIKMVGISGTVAAEAAKKNEDIDLLMVTKKDEMWWWRLYLRLYIWWYKIPHRKFGEKEKSNEFCFNLWLDTDNLGIPLNKRNLKNASDLVMMKIILDKDNTYQKFLRKNSWVKNYLATGYRERRKTPLIPLEEGGHKMFLLIFIKKIINRLLFWGQYVYMWSKVRRKLKNIEKGQAFFHESG
jgi:hypothetical protein